MIVFLRNMTPSIAFCSEEIADIGISLTSGYFWVGRKGSCASHGRFQCGDRWERSTALRGKRLEAGCEWMGWQHLVLSTWGFQVWWIAGSISSVWSLQDLFETWLECRFFMKLKCEKGPPDFLSAWFPWAAQLFGEIFPGIFYSDDWELLSHGTGSAAGSDHHPVYAKFRLMPKSALVQHTDQWNFEIRRFAILRPVLPWNNPRYSFNSLLACMSPSLGCHID